MQLVFCPAFSPSICWEICERSAGYALYRSEVLGTFHSAQLIGFDPVDFPSVRLKGFVENLFSQTFPVAPLRCNMGGIDGEMFHLSLFGDLYSSSHFSWWSDSPPAWEPIVLVTRQMLAEFNGIGSSG